MRCDSAGPIPQQNAASPHVRLVCFGLLAGLMLTAVACRSSLAPSAPPAVAAPKPADGLWRGVHLGINADSVEILKKAIAQRLAPMGINVIVLEVDYGFEYQSHPELRWENPITKAQARELADVCRKHGIRLIPQFQSLGHQSWADKTGPLLIQHPELDETPQIPLGNPGIYCRSWCPLHPKVNEIVFALIDELIDAFDADAVHVGMDEVYLMASDQCPRCRGKDPAALYAKAVNDLYGHIVGKRGLEMLMWGDMLLDPSKVFSSSAGGEVTHPAVDMIPKDIVICDWQYGAQNDYPSIAFFLEKGFRVWPCSWNDLGAARLLIESERRYSHDRMLGHLFTTWHSASDIAEALLYEGDLTKTELPGRAVAHVIRTCTPLILPAPRARFVVPTGTHRFDEAIRAEISVGKEGNYGKPIRSVSGEVLVEDAEGKSVKRLGKISAADPQPKKIAFELPVGAYRVALRGRAELEGDGARDFEIRSSPFRLGKPHAHAAAGARVELANPFSPKYPASGAQALTDGILGDVSWRLGDWQGYSGDDLDATIDLGRPIAVQEIRVNFLQDQGPWIFLPTQVEYALSKNGADFQVMAAIPNAVSPEKTGAFIRPFAAKVGKTEARYVRVRAKSIGVCPEWHAGRGRPAWLFVDEVMVNPAD